MTTTVVKKVNQRFRFLHRIAPLVGRDTLRTLARALIQPHFDYGVHVWHRDASKALKAKLQTVQNKLNKKEHDRYRTCLNNKMLTTDLLGIV